MKQTRAFAAFAIAMISLSTGVSRGEAQDSVSSDAMRAAQAAAGTARVIGGGIVAADSLILTIEDARLTSEALMAREWRLGGREETPRVVGRAIAEAVRSGLPVQSPVKIIVLDVVGAPRNGAQVRFFYPTADPATR